MKSFKNLIVGKERRNDAANLPRWMQGMTTLKNGVLDTASAGYDYAVRTTEQIRAKVVGQQYFEIAPGDFMPVIPGEGAWLEGLVTQYTFNAAGNFGSGLLSLGVGPARIPQVDAGMVAKHTPIFSWVSSIQWNLMEQEKAVAAGNWNPITAKHEAIKKHYDLGLQRLSFLGLTEAGITGLLNSADVEIDTTTITASLATMSAADFSLFVSKIIAEYRVNCAYTAMPDKFAIPEKIYLGLTRQASDTYQNRTRLSVLLEAFQLATGNPKFQILRLAYGDKSMNAGVLDTDGKNRYVLYKDDADCLQMDVPVPFRMLPAHTGNGFTFESVAMSQFGPVVWFRPKTALYFDHE